MAPLPLYIFLHFAQFLVGVPVREMVDIVVKFLCEKFPGYGAQIFGAHSNNPRSRDLFFQPGSSSKIKILVSTISFVAQSLTAPDLQGNEIMKAIQVR